MLKQLQRNIVNLQQNNSSCPTISLYSTQTAVFYSRALVVDDKTQATCAVCHLRRKAKDVAVFSLKNKCCFKLQDNVNTSITSLIEA